MAKSLQKFTILTLFITVLAGCSPAPAPQKPALQPDKTQTTATEGKALYDQNCASCHGAAGTGGSASALNTGKKVQKVIDTIKNGINPVMPAYQGKLNDNQIAAIANYVASLKK